MSMRDKTCCFTGHRIMRLSELETRGKIERIINMLVEKGVVYYGCGGALGFYTIAAKCVIRARQKNPKIKLILVLPCKDQDKMWSDEDKQVYADIKAKADKIVYVSESYTKTCMHERNRHLVDNSAYCISYLEVKSGGTFYTYNYAKDMGLEIYNVAQPVYMTPVVARENW